MTDSGKKASDFATAAQGTKADEAAPQSTTYTKTEVDGLVDDEESRAKGVEQGLDGRLTTAEGDIDTIEGKIPAAASSQNKLVDQQQMNSSISTATATYRGAYNLVSDLELTTAATEQQIAAALATKMTALSIEPDNNDYCFVQIPTADATPTQIARVDRYKYNGTEWLLEYSLNNSGFTAAQWAALNSGITSGLVTKLSDLPTNSELTTLLNGKADKVANATAGNFAGLDGNGNPTDSGKKPADFATAAQGTKADEAAPQATTYTKTEVDALIANFITNSVNDLVNYYLKSDTYTKSEVQQIIAAVKQFTYEVVQTLPTASASTMNKIYLVPSTNPETKNVKDEYITISTETEEGGETVTTYSWEQIGSTTVDLSGYYTSAQTDAAISSALSTALEDYTTTANLTTLLNDKADKSSTVTNVSFNSSTNKIQQTINGITSDVCSIAQGGYQIIENNTTGIDELTPVGGATITDDNTNGLDILTF